MDLVGVENGPVCTYGIDVCESGRDVVFEVGIADDAVEEVVIETAVAESAEAVLTVFEHSVEIGGTGLPRKFTIMETGP